MMRETRNATFSNRDFGQEEAGEARARRLRDPRSVVPALAGSGWDQSDRPARGTGLQNTAPQTPPSPDLDTLPDTVLDSLPWPGQSQNRPPAWMLEEDPPQPAVPKQPSAGSAYEQEWNTLRPKVQNPWHQFDEADIPDLSPGVLMSALTDQEDHRQQRQAHNAAPSVPAWKPENAAREHTMNGSGMQEGLDGELSDPAEIVPPHNEHPSPEVEQGSRENQGNESRTTDTVNVFSPAKKQLTPSQHYRPVKNSTAKANTWPGFERLESGNPYETTALDRQSGFELISAPSDRGFAAKLGEDQNSLLHEYGKEDPITRQFEGGRIPPAIKIPIILMRAAREAMQASNHGSTNTDEVKEHGGLMVRNHDGTHSILRARPGETKALRDENFPSPKPDQRILASYHTHPHPDAVIGGLIYKSEVGMGPSEKDVAKFIGGKYGPVLIVASPEVLHVLVMPDHHLRNFHRDSIGRETGPTWEEMKKAETIWLEEHDNIRQPIKFFRNSKGQRGRLEPQDYSKGSVQDSTLRATLKAIEGRGIYYFRSSTFHDSMPESPLYRSSDRWSSVPERVKPEKP